MAVETFGCSPATGKPVPGGSSGGLDVEVEFPGILVSEALTLKVMPAPAPDPQDPSINIGANRFLIQVQAPKTMGLPGIPADAAPKLRARARIMISTDQAEISALTELNLVQ